MQNMAIDHMNNDHLEVVIDLCKHFGNFAAPTNVKLVALDEKGMDISCDQGQVRVPFLSPANQNGEGFRKAIMDVLNSLSLKSDFSKISAEMVEFIDSRKSVILSSDGGEHCVASYAPFVRDGGDFYILISDIPAHYKAIKFAPSKVQLLFIEDESEAKTIFARRRVSFDASVDMSDVRDAFFAKFEAKYASESPLAMIKKMQDFHVLKVQISKGRLVNGFGAAYDTSALSVVARAGEKMPHDIKK